MSRRLSVIVETEHQITVDDDALAASSYGSLKTERGVEKRLISLLRNGETTIEEVAAAVGGEHGVRLVGTDAHARFERHCAEHDEWSDFMGCWKCKSAKR